MDSVQLLWFKVQSNELTNRPTAQIYGQYSWAFTFGHSLVWIKT